MNDAPDDSKPQAAAYVRAVAPAHQSGRIETIDFLRGLVMVLMALDHTRAIFHASDLNVRDVTEPALFITRWITHICAPAFVFLAGLSANLYGNKVGSRGALSWFLFSRGVFLMALEITLVHFAWTFAAGISVFALQVIWVIGVSMVALAGLVYLPLPVIAGAGLLMIAGHNLLDGIRAAEFGGLAWLWYVLHERGAVYPVPGVKLIVLYPVIPWIGVMAAGYALGSLYPRDGATRRRWLVGAGAVITVGFLALRVSNLYGDPVPWTVQGVWWSSILSILNCEKYPPSLLYLMMTLGPALILLGAFEGMRGRLSHWIAVFGRVPFFYYLAHLLWIGVLSLALTALGLGGLEENDPLTGGQVFSKANDRVSTGLVGVYGLWFFVVATLYPPCAWFARLKRERTGWWWRYL